MNISNNSVVTISFKLFDAGNQLLEESPEPVVYLHGTHSGIFPKIEEALNGKKVGDAISVTMEPVDAFGEYDSKLIRIEPVADLPPDLSVGGHLVAEQDGAEVVWRITNSPDNAFASIARCSMYAPRLPRKLRTDTHTGRMDITTTNRS